MKMRFFLLLVMAVLVFSVGCRKSANVTSPTGGAGAAATQSSFTLKDMREAILSGCTAQHWQTSELDANTIEATLMVHGKHTVVVSIPYTAASYTINYKNSINMNYKAKRDGTYTIHPYYNKWVSNLEQAIQAKIAQKK